MKVVCKYGAVALLAGWMLAPVIAVAQQQQQQDSTNQARQAQDRQTQSRQTDDAQQPGQGLESRRGQAGQDLQQRDRAQSTKSGQTRRQARAGGSGSGDQELVLWLIVDNEKEMALAQMAQQRGQNEQVRQFAQQMMQDHSAFVSKLQQASGGQASATGASQQGSFNRRGQDQSSAASSAQQRQAQPAQQRQAQPAQQQQAQPGQQQSDELSQELEQRAEQRLSDLQDRGQQTQRPAAGQDRQTRGTRQGGLAAQQSGSRGGQINWIAIKRELGQRNLQSAQQELESKPADEFDKCYIGQQVTAHMHMLDTLNCFQQHASPELQTVLQEGAQTTQRHLDQAKQLAEQLEKQQSATAGSDQQRNQSQQRSQTDRSGTSRPGTGRGAQQPQPSQPQPQQP